MKKIITTVICSIVGINTMLMAQNARPKLVVGIVVDQLRTDYIEYLRNHFGDRGFNLLMNRGAYLRDVDFKTPGLDAVSGTALAMTGAYPSANGVTGASVYDRDTKLPMPAMLAPGATPTSGNFSPATLLLSTVGDEVAIDGMGLCDVYSVAADPRQAVILAGHAGKGAVWLDQEHGRWATSPYYGQLPLAASLANRLKAPSAQLDTARWKPLLPLSEYPGIPQQKKFYDFSYSFPHSDRDSYLRWTASPLSNRAVTDIAVDFIRTMKLGQKGEAIDMLNIAYTAAPYKYVKDGDFRLELEDTYIRLDRQLGRLFDAIEAGPGLDNTVVYLTSTGYYDDAAPDDEKYRIPGGQFSKKRAVSLLNSFLSARYGNRDFVEAFAGPRIYLDRRAIEALKLNPDEVIAASREFLCKMSGIRNVYTLAEILSEATPTLENLRRATDVRQAGDLYVDFMPGWTVKEDTGHPVTQRPVRSSMVSTPAFFMGPGVDARRIDTPVEGAALAPTLTQVLRIRSPNGAQARPVAL